MIMNITILVHKTMASSSNDWPSVTSQAAIPPRIVFHVFSVVNMLITGGGHSHSLCTYVRDRGQGF